MMFLKPLRLLGILALIVILFIHLRNKKTKEVYVSSIKLWQKVFQDISKIKKRKVNKYLLLILHLLIGLLIVFIFAEPIYIKKGTDKDCTLAIDCSMSMNAIENGKLRIDIAKEEAKSFLKNSSKDARFNLVCMNNETSILKKSLRKNEVKKYIDSLKAVKEPLDVEKSNLVLDGLGKNVVIFSDKNLFNNKNVVKVGKKLDDIGILYGKYDVETNKCYCMLKNYGDFTKRVSVVLKDSRGKIVSSKDCELDKKEEKSIFFYNIKYYNKLNIQIQNKDMIMENNFYSINNSEVKKKDVLIIGENYYVKKALSCIPYINLIRYSQKQDLEKKYDFYIVCNDFKNNIPNEGNVWWLNAKNDGRSVKGNIHIEDNKLINYADSLQCFGQGFELDKKDKNITKLITINNKTVMGKDEKGNVYSSIDLDKGNLVLTPMFPVIVDNILGVQLKNNQGYEYRDYFTNDTKSKDIKTYSPLQSNISIKNVFIVGIFILLILEWKVFRLEY